MAQKAAQLAENVSTAAAAVTPSILVRIGGRGYNTVAKFVRVTRPRASRFFKNAAVEMAPPNKVELMEAIRGLQNVNLSKIPEMTVNEVGARGLVLAEVVFLFFIGEMIGRGSIIGYNPKI